MTVIKFERVNSIPVCVGRGVESYACRRDTSLFFSFRQFLIGGLNFYEALEIALIAES